MTTKDKQPKQNPHIGHRQRLRQRAATQGIEGFLPHELLELLLFPTIPYKDTNEVAHELLQKFSSLEDVLCAPVPALMSVKNMTQNAAEYLNVLSKLPSFLQKNKNANIKFLKTPQDMYQYLQPYLVNQVNEQFYLLNLDLNFKIISLDLLQQGRPNYVHIDLPNVASIATRRGAIYAVVAHNHPSGSLLPSNDDLEITKKLAASLAFANVHLIDHLILTNNGFYSIAKHHPQNVIMDALSGLTHLLSQSFVHESPFLSSKLNS